MQILYTRHFRRALLALAATEIAAMGLLLIVGMPFEPFTIGPSGLQRVAAGAHAPGIWLLSELGLCCGYNHLVFSDVIQPVHRPTPIGVPLLAIANVVVVTSVVVPLLALASWLRNHRAARAAA